MKEEQDDNLVENLNALSIFSLRELARQSGVKSPTSKKKQELMDEIIAIKQGKKEPIKQNKKHGRPPKGYSYSLSDVFDIPKNIKLNNGFTLKQELPSFSYNDEPEKTCAGTIEVMENKSAFLWVFENGNFISYFIPSQLISNLTLKTGDRIVAKVSNDSSQLVVKDIYDINSQPINRYEPNTCDYFALNHIYSEKRIQFNNSTYESLDICTGENIYFYCNNNAKLTTYTTDLLNSCKQARKIYINVTMTEKNKASILSLNDAELFVTNITDSSASAKRIVSLAIERIKRLIENGQDVVVLIDDVLSLSCVDDAELPLTKSIMSIAKNTNQGSITLFANMSKDRTIAIFEKLADKRINLDELV